MIAESDMSDMYADEGVLKIAIPSAKWVSGEGGAFVNLNKLLDLVKKVTDKIF